MKKNFSEISLKNVISSSATLISIVSYIVWLLINKPNAGVWLLIAILSVLLLIGAFSFRSWWGKYLLFSCTVLLAFTIGYRIYLNRTQAQETALGQLSNETMAAATIYQQVVIDPSSWPWFEDAVLQDEVLYLLVPSSVPPKTFQLNAIDKDVYEKAYPNSISALFSIEEINKRLFLSDYYLAVLPSRFIKKGNTFRRCIVLPESVSLVVKALVISEAKKNFNESYRLLEKADSLGNGAASYYLSDWYSSGVGSEKRPKDAEKQLQKAIDRGTTDALYEAANKILSDTTSSIFDRVKAEDYLLKAVRRSRTESVYTNSVRRHSLLLLNDYYHSTNRLRRAYKLTKEHSTTVDGDIKYNWHLSNCLELGKYDEALKIIEDGKKDGHPQAYIIFGKMLSEGLGVKKDFAEAEKNLRFAADSLNASYAYRLLSDLFKNAGAPSSEVAFWDNLYKINVDNTFEK